MKSVVFICLLSLSLSLSQSTKDTPDHLANASEKAAAPTNTDVKNVKVENATEQNKTLTQPPNSVETNQKAVTETQNATITNQTQSGKNETNTNEESPKTTVKPEGNAEPSKQSDPTKDEKSEKNEVNEKTEKNDKNEKKEINEKNEKNEKNAKEGSTETKVAGGTQGDAKKNETTTEKSQVSSSEASKTVQPVQARAFDGPSFFGGIILTLGLLAIGFMGFKYYKNQTDGNYHTL